VRVNFNYFLSEAVFEFILAAVHRVASEGWKLLPDYRFDPLTGLWHHRQGRPEPLLRLSNLTYRSGKLEYRSRHSTEPEWALDGYLEDARRVLDGAQNRAAEARAEAEPLSADFETLRWFTLPAEAEAELRGEGEGEGEPSRQPLHLR